MPELDVWRRKGARAAASASRPQQRRVFNVRWRRYGPLTNRQLRTARSGVWAVNETGHVGSVEYPKKAQAVRQARYNANWLWRKGRYLTQVRVFGKNGRIQREWTYGRDPKRSRG